MKPENLFHTGIVVDVLDATMDWFTKVADYRWTDVVEAEQIGQTPQGEVTIPMRISPHLRPTDWRARSSRTTPTVPGSFCGRIPRARPDRASNSSAGPWNRSSNTGGRLRRHADGSARGQLQDVLGDDVALDL